MLVKFSNHPMTGSTHTGKGGKGFQDRELAARVRTLTLKECEKALLKGKGQLFEAVLLKLAGSVLPRLNELSGPEGAPIPLLNVLHSDVILNNDSNKEGSEPKE